MKKIAFSFSFLLFVFLTFVKPTFAFTGTPFTVSNYTYDQTTHKLSFDTNVDFSAFSDGYFFIAGTYASIASNEINPISSVCSSTHCDVFIDNPYNSYPAMQGINNVILTFSGGLPGGFVSQNITVDWFANVPGMFSASNITYNPNTGAFNFDYTGPYDLSDTVSICFADNRESNGACGNGVTCTTTHCSATVGEVFGNLATLRNVHIILDTFVPGLPNDINPYSQYLNYPSFTNFSLNTNSPPSVGTISASPNPAQINSTVHAFSNFTDPDTSDTHIAVWDWGDGATTSGTLTESNGSGSVSDSHTYANLGSFTVKLTVTDNGGLSASSQSVIAVIPAGGLTGSNLQGSNYTGANLSNQNISNSNLKSSTFDSVDFTNDNLTGINAIGDSFISANFTNANLTSANLKTANLSNANMTGANLTGANFKGATITGIIWSNTICPNGTNSDNAGGTCVGQGI